MMHTKTCKGLVSHCVYAVITSASAHAESLIGAYDQCISQWVDEQEEMNGGVRPIHYAYGLCLGGDDALGWMFIILCSNPLAS